ncbi:MAG: peptidoglycan DD-metalloendopeptidase family protein [Bacteroidota bacterium]
MNKYVTVLGILLSLFSLSYAQFRPANGGGPAPRLEEHDHGHCVDPKAREQMWEETQRIRQDLIQAGKLNPTPNRGIQIPPLSFPLRQRANSFYHGYYGISNYVDHDNAGGLRDYTCQERTYNGHRGTDYFLWPFSWDMMDREEVEIIAAAPGIIINKLDNNFDRNCSFTGQWNAVYIEHFDGTIAWYGHMKKNTLTAKAIGDSVTTGDYLGLVGSSGFSTGPHLHLELFTSRGSLLDPYDGNCNPTSLSTAWANQRPYELAGLNHIQTGNAPPDLSGQCSNDEVVSYTTSFDHGETVYFSSYFVDQEPTQPASYRVTRPNGQTWLNWNHDPPERYNASWWYWSNQLPANAQDGVWTYQVIFEGDTLTQTFTVGVVTSLEEESALEVFPNPFTNYLEIQGEMGQGWSLSILDLRGRLIRKLSDIQTGQKMDLGELPAGLYMATLSNQAGEQQLVTKIVKQ